MQYSYHADRHGSALFASLWVEALGEQYPAELAPFSSCTFELLEELEQQIIFKPCTTVVDLGCGTGGVALWLARKHSLQLTGIDRCGDAVAIAKQRAIEWGVNKRARFAIGDFCDTGLVSSSTDIVLSIDAFTATNDIESALEEVRRILKPRGDFVFTARQLGPKGRHFEAIGEDWASGLERSGFKDVRVMVRPNVSELWRKVYGLWLKHESELQKELLPDTPDALIGEANRGIPLTRDRRPWCLIKATVIA